jgi:hypothetical protein
MPKVPFRQLTEYQGTNRNNTRKYLMRSSLLIPAAFLALAGCVSVTPAPRPAETTIVMPPTTTYVAPASTTDTTTTVRRTY